MKYKRSAIFISLLSLLASTNAQSYRPFPVANAMWKENAGGFQCSCCADFQYTITGDTTINFLTYHKLLKTGVTYQEDINGFCTSTIQSSINQYAGCFRNDTLNKKIFFVPPSATNDTSLYDFNLSIGDTVPPSPLNNYGSIINVVIGIDSVLMGGVYCKRFQIDNCSMQQLYYIEGIGSTYGLLSPTVCPFEAIYTLVCFTVNSMTVYPDSTTQCSIVTGTELYTPKTDIIVYPNPIQDNININFGRWSGFYRYEITDLTGKIVKSGRITGSDLHIQTSDLPSSMCFLKLIDSGGAVIIRKITYVK